jgi:hypothetical protein
MKSIWLAVLSLCGLCLFTACGGGGGPVIPPFGPIFQFSVSAAGTATAGTAINVTVTARDAANNVVANYSGTVQFTSSDAQAILPTPKALTNGTATFQVTFKTAPAQEVAVTDTATGLIGGNSGPITVNPGPTASLSFTTPQRATTGLQFGITVTAFDAFNNTATNYTGTVSFTSSDPHAAPLANSMLPGGVGNFFATLNSTGGQTFTATDTVTASITGKSSMITVFTNAATHFSIGTPGNAVTRQNLNIPVTALDDAGNTSVGYSGRVQITSTDGKAILPPNSMLTSGAQNFPVTLEDAGNWTITAKDTVTAALTITSPAISVSAPAALAITSNPPPPGTAGVNYAPTKPEVFRCIQFRGSLVCVPCNTPACAALPPCGRGGIFPCRETRQVFGGFAFTATGGIPPYGWSATGLPPVLTVTSGNGEILGTPTSPGNFAVNVTLSDSGNPVAQFPMSYQINIATPPAPVINTAPAPPIGALSLPYTFTFTASTLAPSLTWSISVGPPPPGLSLAPTGVLSGKPTTVGTFPVTLIATDSFNQPSAPQQFQIVIAAHGFAPTGSLVTERLLHTAITLGSGKVLIVGGQEENGVPLASAELYDPAAGTFASTGSMGTVRTCHTATLLQNGMVLVAGGTDATGTALATAELYNPGNGSFSSTGSMGTPRSCPAAVLLGNGQVLVTGGIDSTGVLASAEIYDPTKGTFAPTAGSMNTVRTQHTATLITSTGKVLVTGGNTGGPATAAADLFDPGTGKFTPTGSMGTARFFHSATLLTSNGKVLVAGGIDSSGASFTTAELFDPGAGTFTPTGPMGTARAIHTATLLADGTVLVAGGEVTGGNDTVTAELYDPNAGTFTETGSMGTAREYHAAALLADGKRVLIAGGRTGDGNGALASAELYQ